MNFLILHDCHSCHLTQAKKKKALERKIAKQKAKAKPKAKGRPKGKAASKKRKREEAEDHNDHDDEDGMDDDEPKDGNDYGDSAEPVEAVLPEPESPLDDMADAEMSAPNGPAAQADGPPIAEPPPMAAPLEGFEAQAFGGAEQATENDPLELGPGNGEAEVEHSAPQPESEGSAQPLALGRPDDVAANAIEVENADPPPENAAQPPVLGVVGDAEPAGDVGPVDDAGPVGDAGPIGDAEPVGGVGQPPPLPAPAFNPPDHRPGPAAARAGHMRMNASPKDILRQISPRPEFTFYLCYNDWRFKVQCTIRHEFFIKPYNNLSFSKVFTRETWRESLQTVHEHAWSKWRLVKDLYPADRPEQTEVPEEVFNLLEPIVANLPEPVDYHH